MPRQLLHRLQPIIRWLLVCAMLAPLLWLYGSSLPVAAQYRFDHWTIDNGLPQNAVNAIAQTRDGYLWLATNDGLVRFDGARFFTFNHGNTPRLESNRLLSLYEDRTGTLWIGSGESALTSYQAGQFTSYTANDGLPVSEIERIEEDAAGALWLIGRHDIARWRDGQFTSYLPQDLLPGAVAPERAQNHIWWSRDQAGLHVLSHGRVLTFTAADGLPNAAINSVWEDQRGTLWISARGGLARVVEGRMTVLPLPENTGCPCTEDRQGAVWLLGGKKLQRWYGGVLTLYPEVSGFGSALYEDREGALWIGLNQGLYRVIPQVVQTLRDSTTNLTDWVHTVLEDHAGNIWLGNWGGGLSRYRDGRFTHFFADPGFFSSQVTSMYEDRAGVLWIGTLRGMTQFKDGKFSRYSDEHGLRVTQAVHQDRAGDFWFGTTTGLAKLHDGVFTVYTMKDGLPSDNVMALHEDRAGTLWIGTHGGLAHYKDGSFTTYTEREGLVGKRVRALHEDETGALWIGTYDGGLTRLKDGRLTGYTTRDGLFGNGVFRILDDGRGYFWMSCNTGIFRVSKQELNDFAARKISFITSAAFGTKDGMLDAECNGGHQPAGWRTHDGRLWFPTQSGVAIIDPAALSINSAPPPIVIEECRLDREVVPFDQQLRIAPGQDNLEIQYTANCFLNPGQIRFQYKLTGFDQDWVEAGNRRVAYYPHLPPGAYTFTVLTANSDGVWNNEGRSLKIIVVPPFWKTFWFWSLITIGIVGTAWLAYRRRIAALRAFSRRLIDSQERERARIASELHDSLSQLLLVIRNRALIGAQASTDPPAREQFDEINTSATQALSEVREIAHNLRPYQLDRHGLTAGIEVMLEKIAGATPIQFTTELANLDGLFPPDAEINLYRIVQESINNIVKHSQATAARIEITRTARAIRLTIADNGRGFTPEAAGAGQGFGLTDIAERVRLLGGSQTMHNAPGQGTTINVAIPYEGVVDVADDALKR